MKRVVIWTAVLAVAIAAGFGLGALTYKPPAPGMDEPVVQMESVAPTSSPAGEVLPDLVGMSRAAAEKRLDDIGLLFLVNPVKGKDDDRVVAQNPASGTLVRRAKHLLLSVRCEPRPCPQPPEGKQLYDPCACQWR